MPTWVGFGATARQVERPRSSGGVVVTYQHLARRHWSDWTLASLVIDSQLTLHKWPLYA